MSGLRKEFNKNLVNIYLRNKSYPSSEVQKKASERSHLFDLPSFINWFDLFLKHVNSY